MIKFIFTCLLCGTMTFAFSQGRDISPIAPDEVLKGFIRNYSDAKATWKESEGIYEASFKLIGMPAQAWYDSTGHRLKMVVEVKEEQLPAIARSYIERNYPKAKVVSARKWTDDKKVSTFEAVIKAGTETKTLMFTSRGDIINLPGTE